MLMILAALAALASPGERPVTRVSRSFDGVAKYGSLPNRALCSTSMSFLASFRLDTLAVNKTIFSDWTFSTDGGFAVQVSSTLSDELQVFVASSAADTGAHRCLTSDADIQAGAWHTLLVLYDGTASGNSNRLRLVLDGRALSCTFTGTIPASLRDTAGAHGIGTWFGSISRRWGGGHLDEIVIWCSVMTWDGVMRGLRRRDRFGILPVVWLRLGDGDTEPGAENSGTTGGTATMSGGTAADYVKAEVPR